MDSLGTGEWIVIGLSLIIFLFFIIGNYINNQRSRDVLRWLRRGLATFGEVKSSLLSAPTTSGIRMKIEPADGSPLKDILVNLVLERRENLPLWIYQLLRGKRDHLVIMANVQPIPEGEVHGYHQSNLGPVEAARRGEKASLTFVKQAGDFHIFVQGGVEPNLVNRVEKLVAQYPALLREASLVRKSPQLTIDLRFSALKECDPQSFFQSIKAAL